MNGKERKKQGYFTASLFESGLRLCAYYGVWLIGDQLFSFIAILLGIAELIKLYKDSLWETH